MNTKLLFNGVFWNSSDPCFPHDWIRIKEEKIVSVGNKSSRPSPECGEEAIDLEGREVLPGLMDAHIHIQSLGSSLQYLDFREVSSLEELQEMLKETLQQLQHWRSLDLSHRSPHHLPRGIVNGWIVGRGWDQDRMNLPFGRPIHKRDIDQVISPDLEIPVVLFRACNHIGTLNSVALKILNLTEDSRAEGGSIDLDEDGSLTGVLRENALNPIFPKLEEDVETKKYNLKRALRGCLQSGLTAVQTNDSLTYHLYQQLQEEGELPIRVFLTVYHWDLDDPLTPLSSTPTDRLLSVKRVKLLADGSLGASTASLSENYCQCSHRGMLIHSPEELASRILHCHQRGFQLEVHAIGDLAAKVTLDGFRKAGAIGKKYRPVLTHCQILSEKLIRQMVEDGVVANVQPSFVNTDSFWVDQRIPPSMQKFSYAWKTLLDQGVIVSGGSDAPIEHFNPFLGLHSAIFRPGPGSKPWKPEECLTFEEAVKIYTENAAFAVFEEDRLGKIAEGYAADFVVIDREVSKDPARLLEAKPAQVWVDGINRLSKLQKE